jgi:hypothetical protein
MIRERLNISQLFWVGVGAGLTILSLCVFWFASGAPRTGRVVTGQSAHLSLDQFEPIDLAANVLFALGFVMISAGLVLWARVEYTRAIIFSCLLYLAIGLLSSIWLTIRVGHPLRSVIDPLVIITIITWPVRLALLYWS